jgi:CheY-like chemotaxis protein
MKKILIAEDQEDIHHIYSKWLKDNYELIQAYTGREAVDSYKNEKPDLTLMDIKMPGMYGDEAITQIFDHDPKANIIAVTAYDYTEEDLKVPVVRKGFKKEEFMDVVRAGIKGEPIKKPRRLY